MTMPDRDDHEHDLPEPHRGSAPSGSVDLHFESRGRGNARRRRAPSGRRDAGHFYVTEEPRADEDVARFLVAHTPERGQATRLLARARRRLGGALAGAR
jgi:hypothetical protein